MPHGDEAVKVIDGALALGFSVSEAIQRALGTTLTAFAEMAQVRIQEVSMCLAAYHQRTYPEIRERLAAELGVSREYLDRVIDSQRPAEPAEGVA